jgi:DNA-binding transcriptional MerR regulator
LDFFYKESKKGAWLPEAGLGRTDFPPDQISNFIEFNVTPLYRQEAFLRSEYIEKERSIHEIARKIFVSKSTVAYYMERFGIPLRSYDESQFGQLGYGQQRRNGRKVRNKIELATIERIVLLRRQGFSYHKIAEILNTLAIPTKTKRSKWHGTTVMNLIKAGAPSSYEPIGI